MADSTVIAISSLLILIAGFAVVGITTQQPSHYCLDKQIKAYCYSLSSTAKTCYTLPSNTGGKLCGAAWELIPFIKEEVPTFEPLSRGTGARKFKCDMTSCTEVFN